MSAPTEKGPSYEALLIIAQSVCGALERAGVTDCDDPGEAIDVIRENLEAKVSFLESERRRLQEGASAHQPPSGGEPMTGDLLPCPFCGKSNQDRYPCEWLDDSGANVIRCAWCHGAAPAKTWNRRPAPPSAPVGKYVQHPSGDGFIVSNDDPHRLLTVDEILAAMNRPSAPVGVEGFDAWWKSKRIDPEFPDMMDDHTFAKTLWEAAIAQQPAAEQDAEQFRKGWQAGFAEGRREQQQPAAVDGALSFGQRVEWQDDVGSWFPGTIVGISPATYGAKLDDGFDALGYKRTRFRALAAQSAGAQSAGAQEGGRA